MSKLLVIVGSTRPEAGGQPGGPVGHPRGPLAHQGFETEVARPAGLGAAHLRRAPGDDRRRTTRPTPIKIVLAWNKKVKPKPTRTSSSPRSTTTAFPPGLKNAIDTVWLSYGFRNKPVAAVGYSSSIGAGIRAIEHLAQVFIETEAVPLRNARGDPVRARRVRRRRPAGRPRRRISRLQVMLDDLAWWSSALEKARAAGELRPGVQRVRAAPAAVQA